MITTLALMKPQIKTVTLRNWIKKEMVPAHKVGKLWKFKRSELDEWVKSGKSAIN